jgi:hypothetical protein
MGIKDGKLSLLVFFLERNRIRRNLEAQILTVRRWHSHYRWVIMVSFKLDDAIDVEWNC